MLLFFERSCNLTTVMRSDFGQKRTLRRVEANKEGPNVITDKALARELTSRLLEASNTIERTVGTAQDGAKDDEFLAYREGIAKVLEIVLWELLNPIFKQHPDIKPEGWDDPYTP